MSKQEFTRDSKTLSQYFQLPNPGIARYFGHVYAGQPEVYRSTFYAGKVASNVLFDWNKRLGRIGSQWPTLLAFEMDLAKKVGPLSVMQPLNKRMDDIELYYSLGEKAGLPVSENAIKATLDSWKGISDQSAKLKGLVETYNDTKQKSTNSGSPYFTRRRNAFHNPFHLWLDGDEIVYSDSKWSGNLCAVLGWRGQEGGPNPDDVKQRVVWMFPFPLNLREAQVYQVLISRFQRYGYIPAWNSNEAVDKHITLLFDTKDDNDLIICTDFSKYDQHFNPSLQEAARSCISQMLQPNAESQEWLSEIYPMKYMIPMMFAEGHLMHGRHGMGSGSGGTNFDETMAHRCLQNEAAIDHGKTLNPYSMCLGDDGILSYPQCSVDQVIETYTKHGLDMNPSKQYVSTQDCVYLRRWHHKDYRVNGVCVGVYSTCRALGKLMYQERFYDPKVWGPKMVALRQLSIIEGCKYHPLREEFAEFCMKGDKYRLGIDIPGFLVNIEREAMEATDYMPDFLGYVQSNMESNSIDNWWIVNYLRNRA